MSAAVAADLADPKRKRPPQQLDAEVPHLFPDSGEAFDEILARSQMFHTQVHSLCAYRRHVAPPILARALDVIVERTSRVFAQAFSERDG